MFANRRQAGLLLARQVSALMGGQTGWGPAETIIVGLPRGGVPVALEVALQLGCPLDVLVAKKIGAPGQSEYAIGAVSSDGCVVLDERTVQPSLSRYIEYEKTRLTQRTRVLERHWAEAAGLKRPSWRGRQVVLVDDGVATGMTAAAAIRSARSRGAALVIFACPVMSSQAYDMLSKEADAVVTLQVSPDFEAVGQFYYDFHQVGDSAVIAALTLAAENLPGLKASGRAAVFPPQPTSHSPPGIFPA